MTVRLEIFKSDGSTYWVEHFNSEEECERWLAEEKTRHYWIESYRPVVTVIPDPPPPIEKVGWFRRVMSRFR